MSNGMLLLVRLLVSGSLCAAVTWGTWKAGRDVAWTLINFLLSFVVVAFAIRRPLVEFLHEGFTWMSQRPMMKWQGRYYAFDNVQVRVFEEEDDLWFVVKDVLAAVNMKAVPDSFLATYPDGAKVIPGTLLTAMNSKALEHLLGKRNENQSIRFLQWMQREVLRPWQRKKERGL